MIFESVHEAQLYGTLDQRFGPVLVNVSEMNKPGSSGFSKDEAHKLIERFDKVGKVEYMEGFLGLEVHLTENLKDHDEVSVVTRWRSREDFNAWTQSKAFRESHTHRNIPDYILSNKISFHEVKIVRQPLRVEDAPASAV